jgi:cytochrome c oxidase subunit 4
MSGDHHGSSFYWKVFGALTVLTVVTVAVAVLPWHLGITIAVILALFIATIKGSLVAAYFMHLKGEKSIVYWVLALTVFFFIVLMAVPVLTEGDQAGEAIAPVIFHHHDEGHGDGSPAGDGREASPGEAH